MKYFGDVFRFLIRKEVEIPGIRFKAKFSEGRRLRDPYGFHQIVLMELSSTYLNLHEVCWWKVLIKRILGYEFKLYEKKIFYNQIESIYFDKMEYVEAISIQCIDRDQYYFRVPNREVKYILKLIKMKIKEAREIENIQWSPEDDTQMLGCLIK